MLKQRRESITQYQNAARQDLADQEIFEVGVIQAYLPAQLSETEVDAAIQAAMVATGASTIKDMGKVMGQLKTTLQGRADMGAVGAKNQSPAVLNAGSRLKAALRPLLTTSYSPVAVRTLNHGRQDPRAVHR